LTEADLAGTINEEYIYFNGARIARVDRPSGTVHYYFSNHLGSHTMVTSATGSCEQDIDYYPYGGVITDHCPNVAQHYKFTGKERDAESGNDFFGARYYTSTMGRFLTPDWGGGSSEPVPYADLDDPQTLNLYAYVQNNPLSRTDPFGHGDDPCHGNTNTCTTVTATPDSVPLIQLGLAWGHHFVDRAIVAEENAQNSLAGHFFRLWRTGGPLQNPGVHTGFPKQARLSQDQVRAIVQKVKDLTGKNMSEWGQKEINMAVDEVRSAGGDTGKFLSDIAAENPTVRTVEQDAGDVAAAAQSAYDASKGFVVNVIEDVEEECAGAPNCGLPPP
jgi:RHS repeat-associated protein